MGVILIIKGASHSAPVNPPSSGGGSGSENQPTQTPTVATPVISVDGNTVSITCATTGAVIHYTTDGSAPSAASDTYSAPFTLALSATIRAIAVKTGYNNSAVAQRRHTVVVQTVPIVSEETSDGYLNSAGGVVPLGGWTRSDYVEIPENASKVTGTINTYHDRSRAICFYDQAKTCILAVNDLAELGPGCNENSNDKCGTIIADIPEGAVYLRYCYSTTPNFPSPYNKATLSFII